MSDYTKKAVSPQKLSNKDYEIKPYVSSLDESFAESGLPSDNYDAFAEGFEDGFEENNGPPEIPEPSAGDIATVINLDGSLSFAGMDVPDGYDDLMSVTDYLDKYFEDNPPIEVGSSVRLAIAAVDEAGEDMNLPEDMVVVTEVKEDNPPDNSMTDPTKDTLVKYFFLLKDNLDIFQTQDMDYDVEYVIINFEGSFSAPLLLGTGGTEDDTIDVQTYVTDHIKNGFVPYGFKVGYEGRIRPDEFLTGSIQFYNPETQNLRGRNDWYINLLPSNVAILGEPTYDEIEEESPVKREKKVIERDTNVRRDRFIKDETLRLSYWVNPRNGKIRESDSAPGNVWLSVPTILLNNGTLFQGTLQGVTNICKEDGTKYTETLSKAGYPTEVVINTNIDAWEQNLKSLGGNRPITYTVENGSLVLRYK